MTRAPSRGLTSIARGDGVVLEGAGLLVVFIGSLGRHGTGLVGMLNKVPAAVGHEFDPPAVQCESQAPPDLLKKHGLGCFFSVCLIGFHCGKRKGELQRQ